jgi:hypothetical protein
MARKHHLRQRIQSIKSYKMPSLIDCLMLMMILMMLAVMMTMLVEAMVMVSTGGHRWWQ